LEDLDMPEGTTKNLKLWGDGSSPGGEYHKIKITGQGSVNGDVTAKQGKIIGQCDVQGNAAIDDFHLTGQGKVDGQLLGNMIKVTGDLNVRQSIQANLLHLRGYVTANGHVDLEKMVVKGGFNINGLLNVGELTVNLQVAPSKVREIGGEHISVKSRSLLNRSYSLEADVIEGDNIYLEHTTANIVRGHDIELGPGCHIELVEYRSTYQCKPKNAKKIGNVKQI
jgi:cytoskeletal protein CcmA (bactofilin family)